MFDFVPLIYYADIFFYVLLLIVAITAVNAQFGFTRDRSFESLTGWFLLTFVIFYIGLRPVSGTFIDMTTYARIFTSFQEGRQIPDDGDFFFYLYTYWAAKIMTVEMYFLLCALIYILPLYFVSRRWFGQYWYYSFLLLVCSFSFWNFGTNGIRNGMATSLFLFALAQRKTGFILIWMIAAVLMHKSLLLPAAGYAVAHFLKSPKYLIGFWGLCIPLSIVGGNMWETFFAGLGFGDDRLEYLTAEINSAAPSGFRWDFLIFSALPIIAGYYYIYVKNYRDHTYFLLLNTYIFANAFWVLVIRASFSNRFAYLSWFLMGVIIIYPLLKTKLIPRQYQVIGVITLFYFAFTFILNVILS